MMKLGFVIPPNVFGGGLRINHFGNIVVNSEAKIGEWCDIHQGVNIGTDFEGDPKLVIMYGSAQERNCMETLE